MLGNLPTFRSRFSAIHLVAMVKRSVLSEYGMDPMLRPFVDDLKKLVSMYNLVFSEVVASPSVMGTGYTSTHTTTNDSVSTLYICLVRYVAMFMW